MIGNSEFTPEKQRFFGELINKHIPTCQAIFAKYPRWAVQKHHFFDLTAGSGYHPQTAEPGSVILFLRRAQASGIPCQIHLFEKDPDTYLHLVHNIAPFTGLDMRAYNCDHNDYLPAVIGQWPAQAKPYRFGLIYYDPNSTQAQAGKSKSVEMLADLSRDPRLLRIDILMHIAANQLKRARGAFGFGETLEGWLQRFEKQYWLVTEPRESDQHVMLLGTNWRGGFESMKSFFALYSEPGSRIWQRINFSKREMQERAQPALFS